MTAALRVFALTIIVLTTFALGITGCGGDDDETSDASASPTAAASPAGPATAAATAGVSPTPADAETSDAAGFSRFAVRALDPAIRARDVNFLRARMKTQPVVCTEQDVNPQGAGGPVCQSVGQRYDGFPIGAWRSEGAIVPADDAVQSFQRLFDGVLAGESDGHGAAGPEVYATSFGNDHARAVITAIVQRPPDFAGTGPLRAAISTSWTFEDGRWLMTDIIVAYVLAEDFLQPTEEGRLYYPNWERLAPPQ